MPDAVVVLGAGASAEFGVPVLSRIFKERHAREYLARNEQLREQLNDLFWEPRGHDLETSDASLTIEEMLTVLKDWDEADVEGPATENTVKELQKDLYVLIYNAVFRGKTSRRRYLNPLLRFARENFDHTTWASFNWDCIFESSFYYSSDRPPPHGRRHNPSVVVDLSGWRRQRGSHTLLKLHGSVNWWMVDGGLHYVRFGGGGPLEDRWEEYANEDDPDDFPVILEPSFYKYDPDDQTAEALLDQLRPQWTEFLDRLVNADFVLVIGYSLPPADSLARANLMTARQVNWDARWLVVDRDPDTCSRYERLIGGRDDNFQALEKRLSEFVGSINGDIRSIYWPDCFEEVEPF